MGPTRAIGAEVKKAAALAFAALAVAAATAGAAAEPFGFDDPDLRLAWEESAPSFGGPTFQEYLDERANTFRAAVPEYFSAAAGDYDRDDGSRPAKVDGRSGYSLFEANVMGGTAGRAQFGGFYGLEVKFVDADVSYKETRNRSGDELFDNSLSRADAEAAFSDEAGTTVGFSADYEGNRGAPRPGGDAVGASRAGVAADSGELGGFFRSNLWGKAKFSTYVSGAFCEGEYGDLLATDQVLAADSAYDFFWLGNKHARGMISLNQENYAAGAGEEGILFGKLRLDNDFPIADRLYVSGGFGAFLYKSDGQRFRLYPSGRLLYRIGRGWGCFATYQPALAVPSYRELFVRNDYATPTPYRPFADAYFAFRSGLTYHFRDAARIVTAFDETHYRNVYALEDAAFGATNYTDVGKSAVRSGEFSYRLSWPRLEHSAGVVYNAAELHARPGARFPYLPRLAGDAGVKIFFAGGHSASATVKLIGRRYPTPLAVAPLGAALVPEAEMLFRFHANVGLTVSADNLTDVEYVAAGGVLAPGRSFGAGINLTI
jgi:hypothetical protein